MRSWQEDVLNSGYLPDAGRDTLNKLPMLNVFVAIFVLTAVPFCIYHFAMRNLVVAFLLLAGLVVVIGARILIGITGRHRLVFVVLISFVIGMLLWSYLTGGIDNNGPLWYFAFPMASMILLGPFQGTIASLFLISASLSFHILPFPRLMTASYEPEFVFLHLISYFIVLIFAFSYEFQKQKDNRKIKELKGFLPICSHCKKIRDDEGYWNHLEAYISSRSEAQFSHGICPPCAEKHFPGIDD